MTFFSGVLRYEPAPDFHGADSFAYTIADGTTTASATVTVLVLPVNDAPVAIADSASTPEDVPIIIGLLTNDYDVDGDSLTLTLPFLTAQGGALSASAGGVTYTPPFDFYGADSFTYSISDRLVSVSTSVSILVAPMNEVPTLGLITPISVAEASTVTLTLQTTDRDHDTLMVTVSWGDGTTPATFSHSTGTLLLSHFYADDSAGGAFPLMLTAKDPENATVISTTSVFVTNLPPADLSLSTLTARDGVLYVAHLFARDVAADLVTWSKAAGPAWLLVSQAGDVTGTPATSDIGNANLSIEARDGDGGLSTATFTISVANANVVVAYDDAYILDEDNVLVAGNALFPATPIGTFAGNGIAGFSGDGGPATATRLNAPFGVAEDSAGNVYITDAQNARIRRVSPDGLITTIAGNGTVGFSGDGGPASTAMVGFVAMIFVDASDDIYFADNSNQRVRKIDTAGIITTVAGTGVNGFGGNGGPAINAELSSPVGVVKDTVGNLFISETGSQRVRKVSTNGIISTYLSGLATPYGLAADGAGNLYVATNQDNRVRRVTPGGIVTVVAGNGTAASTGDGGPATSAGISAPKGLALDKSANLLISEANGHRVRRVDSAGIISTLAGTGVAGYAGDGAAASIANLNRPDGIAVSTRGDLLICDTNNHRVRRLTTGQGPTVLANDVDPNGGSIFATLLSSPAHGTLAFQANGSFSYTPAPDFSGVDAFHYFAGSGSNQSQPALVDLTIRPVNDPAQFQISVTTRVFENSTSTLVFRVIDKEDAITDLSIDWGDGSVSQLLPGVSSGTLAVTHFYVDNNPQSIYVATLTATDSGGLASSAQAFIPVLNSSPVFLGITVASGTQYVPFQSRLSAVDVPADSLTWTLPFGRFGLPDWIDLSTDGVVSGTPGANQSGSFTLVVRVTDDDGAPAISAIGESNFSFLISIASANAAPVATGDAYVFDLDSLTVSTGSTITSLAGTGAFGFSGDGGLATLAKLNSPQVAVTDQGGNTYIGDENNFRIRRVDSAGIISTLAGTGTSGFSGDNGPAALAKISRAWGIVPDTMGGIIFADFDNNRVRKISSTGIITTIAGNGSASSGGDGGLATSASVNLPAGVAMDATGNIYVSEFFGNRVRKITPAGVITTYAGNGNAGFSGDGGLAKNAMVSGPRGLAVDANGNLLIADFNNTRVRKVTPGGTITTVAGTGTVGFSGDGGPATSAALAKMNSVAVDSVGNFYIDTGAQARVRRVNPQGVITTVAGTGLSGSTGDGGPAGNARFTNVVRVSIAPTGNLLVIDPSVNKIRLVRASFLGRVTTNDFDSDGDPLQASLLSSVQHGSFSFFTDGRFNYAPDPGFIGTDGFSYSVFDGKIQSSAAIVTFNVLRINKPPQVQLASAPTTAEGSPTILTANLGDVDNSTLTVSLDWGDGTAPQVFTGISTGAASFSRTYADDRSTPGYVVRLEAFDSEGLSAVALTSAIVTNVAPSNLALSVSTIMITQSLFSRLTAVDVVSDPITWAKVSGPSWIAVAADGSVSGTPQGTDVGVSTLTVSASDGDGGVTQSALLITVYALHLAPTAAGETFTLAEDSALRLQRFISTASAIITVAGSGGAYGGDGGPAVQAGIFQPRYVAWDAGGNMYFTERESHVVRKIATNGIISRVAGTRGVPGSSGDGGPAAAALLNTPSGITVDQSGTLFIADTGNARIRKVTPDGKISSVPASGLVGPFGITTASGSLYVTDWTANTLVRITTNGATQILAGGGSSLGDGGPASQSTLNLPRDVDVGPDGSIFIADAGNSRVRRIAPDGTIWTVAGNGAFGNTGDGGLATSAQLGHPASVAVDLAGRILITDFSFGIVRRVGLDGKIATIVGTGASSFVSSPQGIDLSFGGDLLIADSSNHRIRVVKADSGLSVLSNDFDPEGKAVSAILLCSTRTAVSPTRRPRTSPARTASTTRSLTGCLRRQGSRRHSPSTRSMTGPPWRI
ncbi:MAG: hypothetical protein FD129_39 [bacterium]|nr:MAG: hypothetical protein FD129_39 [bacterium]